MKRRASILLLPAALVFSAAEAFAQATNVAVASNVPAAPIITGLNSTGVTSSFIRVLGALFIVFAVFFGLVWLFKNWQRVVVRRGSAPKLGVLEVKSLGARHSLYVIGYEEQRFLISSSPTGTTMLTQLPSAQPGEEIPASTTPAFGDVLARVIGKK